MASTSDLPLSSLTAEERRFLERAWEMVESCADRGTPRFTAFLDERQQRIARSVGSVPGVECGFFGGYAGAERALFYAVPDYLLSADGEENLFPIVPVTAAYPERFSLEHRDFLGALMNLGLRREAIGDILIGSGVAVLFLWEPVAELVLTELTRVGRVGIRLTRGKPSELPSAHSFETITGTVSSMRLDCVVSFLTRESRDDSARLVRSGLVTVNAAVVESPSAKVGEGDKISVRGHGKFIVGEIGAPTKKDRLHLTCQKYR